MAEMRQLFHYLVGNICVIHECWDYDPLLVMPDKSPLVTTRLREVTTMAHVRT